MLETKFMILFNLTKKNSMHKTFIHNIRSSLRDVRRLHTLSGVSNAGETYGLCTNIYINWCPFGKMQWIKPFKKATVKLKICAASAYNKKILKRLSKIREF